jgi:hypothetical protein
MTLSSPVSFLNRDADIIMKYVWYPIISNYLKRFTMKTSLW